MGFRFTVQARLVLTIRLFPFDSLQSLCLKRATHMGHRIDADIQCLADFGLRQTFIYFE
jgi:hypothetical protein